MNLQMNKVTWNVNNFVLSFHLNRFIPMVKRSFHQALFIWAILKVKCSAVILEIY